MKTVGTLHGSKAKIGKTRRYRQHRQQHHALPALALQMFIFLCPALSLHCRNTDHHLWQQQHGVRKQVDGKTLQNHVVGAKDIQQHHIKGAVD